MRQRAAHDIATDQRFYSCPKITPQDVHSRPPQLGEAHKVASRRERTRTEGRSGRAKWGIVR